MYKLVNAVARFSRHYKDFVLAQPAYEFAMQVADNTASAFEEETLDVKLVRLTAAKRALAECMYCVWLADEEGYETLKVIIAAELVRIHLELYIRTLTR
jgi:hypothetical protein